MSDQKIRQRSWKDIASLLTWSLGALYGLGLVTRTIYYSSVGVPSASLLEADYVIAGLMFAHYALAPTVLVIVLIETCCRATALTRGYSSIKGAAATLLATASAAYICLVLLRMTQLILFEGWTAPWAPAPELRSSWGLHPFQMASGLMNHYSGWGLLWAAWLAIAVASLPWLHRMKGWDFGKATAVWIGRSVALLAMLFLLSVFAIEKLDSLGTNFGGGGKRTVRIEFVKSARDKLDSIVNTPNAKVELIFEDSRLLLLKVITPGGKKDIVVQVERKHVLALIDE